MIVTELAETNCIMHLISYVFLQMWKIQAIYFIRRV